MIMKQAKLWILAAILTTCGVNVFTACSSSDVEKAADNQQHYQYLYAAEERENVTEEQRAEYASYAWRLEFENKTGMPLNWRTSMSEFVERDLLNGYDPDYEPSRKGLAAMIHKVPGASCFRDGSQTSGRANRRRPPTPREPP